MHSHPTFHPTFHRPFHRPFHGTGHRAARLITWLITLLALLAPPAASAAEHREFDATLEAPFVADATGARSFSLTLSYPQAGAAHTVRWQLQLVAPDGRQVRQWEGVQVLLAEPVVVAVRWDGRLGGTAAPAGLYRARLLAFAQADGSVTASADDVVEQSWDIAVGPVAAAPLPPFVALPRRAGAGASAKFAPAAGALPYTVQLGNLHSQSAHSDGGGELATCSGAQQPQSAPYGPADAYAYAMEHGLDLLVTSEHNHMYDGADGTNGAADPAAASALYRTGLRAAADFNAAHPGFLAVYGLEWGVIANGGHMNIFNTPELLGWERNDAGQLIADTYTAKGDYGALYALMRERGWVGQFNHPASGGQFLLGGVALGYSDDGDQVMALCEVVNSYAFSTNTSETEPRRSNFEAACNKALEAGYHVAFSSNQDNHCANWGASYSNRTGVLLPAGQAISTAALVDALKARRVFATMDKQSQLVLTANGRMMGERFVNQGPLALLAQFASAAGKTVAALQMVEGVPGRNGSVSILSTSAATTITPAPGEHFYYARVTQDDGKLLWSAPVWVTQLAPAQP